jgi:hypothetical protein
MQSGTSAAKTPRWRSRHRNSIIQEVDGEQIATPQDLRDKIRAARIARKENVTIPFGRPPKSHMTSDGMPQLHFDQLNVVAHHLHAVRTGEDQNYPDESWSTPTNGPNGETKNGVSSQNTTSNPCLESHA